MTSLTRSNNNLVSTSIQVPHASTGIAKGFFAVVLFAMTIPMTKLALPLFSPELIAACRAFFAGLLALVVIGLNRWSLPDKQTCVWIALAGAGVVVGFPYLLSYSLVNLSAANMGVVLAGLPLMTSLFAAVIMKERYSRGFWISSALGALLLLAYFLTGVSSAGWNIQTAGILCLVLIFGGLGYSAGAKASQSLGGWQTICWMLVLYLPFSAIAFGYYAADEAFINQFTQTINNPAEQRSFWISVAGLLWLAVISQWWGFRFWYQAMAEAGAGRISQIQLLQPFFTLFFAVIFLGESFALEQGLFALLIVLAICSALRSKPSS
ncbi:MAG: DMT family transporter [Oleispira antarctica]|nr:DMT family transporter [Oleispira antarctica]MBQ0793997.1 DMT family transporter [Oleispira antarctica]